jgi:hypothetical protein
MRLPATPAVVSTVTLPRSSWKMPPFEPRGNRPCTVLLPQPMSHTDVLSEPEPAPLMMFAPLAAAVSAE